MPGASWYPTGVDAALWVVCVAAATVAAGCWLVSIATGNYSQVDRIWSIVPALYVGWFAWQTRFANPRLLIMTVLVTAWAVRLTYNFARKGGYRRGGEDYRWPVLRAQLGPVKFQIFNATFIAPVQNAILLALTLPAWMALKHVEEPLGLLDLVATIGFVVLLVGETVADNQQWRFHADKHARIARGEVVEERFLRRGLFRYSRHPNFLCEQGMWWCIYLFSVAATGRLLNVSILGVAVLTALFQGSTAMTEKLTLRKYPEYAEYQRTTPRLLPW